MDEFQLRRSKVQMSFPVQPPEDLAIAGTHQDKQKFISVTVQIQRLSRPNAKCSLMAGLHQ